jgi:hypothetical protein
MAPTPNQRGCFRNGRKYERYPIAGMEKIAAVTR